MRISDGVQTCALPISRSPDRNRKASRMIRLAIHGGAGELDNSVDTREQRSELRRIVNLGLKLLRDGASSLDAVERMVIELEICPLFNAGVGGVLNRDGDRKSTRLHSSH